MGVVELEKTPDKCCNNHRHDARGVVCCLDHILASLTSLCHGVDSKYVAQLFAGCRQLMRGLYPTVFLLTYRYICFLDSQGLMC